MTRIPVNPELLTWARERAGLDTLALSERFPRLREWVAAKRQPNLRQIEDFAGAKHVSVGDLRLSTPPQDPPSSSNCARLRDTPLSMLISGELRVRDAENFIGIGAA